MKGDVDANLLDTLNEQDIKDLAIFGICEKQLACHSCRVNFKSRYDVLPPPGEHELDVLYDLGHWYIEKYLFGSSIE